MATDHDFKIKNGLQVEGFLLIGKEALSSSSGYMGIKTSNMSGVNDYMMISGTGDNNTYISAKAGASVIVRGGGNNTSHQLVISSTGASFDGNLTVSGNLAVNGTTVTVDTTNLQVQDNNITLNYSTGDSSSSANGAGITIQDAVNSTTDATILWDASADEFDFSHTINISGELYATNSSNNLVIGNSASGNIYLGGGNNNTSNIYLQTGSSVALTLNSSNDATFAGSISSGAIASTGTISTTGQIEAGTNLQLGGGYNLSWGGAYSSGNPTIAANSNTLYFYPTGNVSGQRLYLNASKLVNAGIFESGDIGINIANPSSALDIRGAGTGASQKNTIAFGTSGWGAPTAPNAALDGGVKLALFEGGTQKVQIGMDGNARLWLMSAGSGAQGVDIYTGSSNTSAPSLRFRVDQSGTTNIYGALSASGNLTGAALLIDGNTAVDKSGTNYMVFHDGGGGPALYAGNSSDNRNYYQSNHHRFRSDDASTTFAELSSSGLRIGGASTPAEKLHVESGNIRADGAFIVSGTTVIDSSRVVQNVTLGHSTTGARFETNDWMYDTGNTKRFYFEGSGRTFFGSDNGYVYRDSSDVGRATISNYGGINLLSGGDGQVNSNVALAVGGNTVIDSSRNFSNIVTLTAQAINTTANIDAGGRIKATNWLELESAGAAITSEEAGIRIDYNDAAAWYIYKDNGNDAALQIQSTAASGEGDGAPRVRFNRTARETYFGGSVGINRYSLNSGYELDVNGEIRSDGATIAGALDVTQNIQLDSHTFADQEEYSGTSIFSQSGDWYTLASISESTTPAYFALKFGAHSTVTFSVTTGYVHSNVATINVLGSTWTQNGGYPGASELRIVKQTDTSVYYVQMRLTYSSGPTGFTLAARTWGATPASGTPSLVTSLSVYSATHSTIAHVYTNYNGTGSSSAHYNNNGSNSAPSYSFSGDTNTGMYRDTADSIGFATDGTQRTTISNSGLDIKSGSLRLSGTDTIDASRNVISPSFRPGVNNAWKIRGNNGNAYLSFEYSTSSTLADTNIKAELGNTGNFIVGDRLSNLLSGYQVELKKASTSIGDGGGAGALNLRATGNFYIRHNGYDALTFNGSSIVSSDTFISGSGITPTGSVIGNVRSYGATNAYMGCSDEAGRTAFFGVDTSGYAMFGALTNHNTVIRANNSEKLRIQTNGVINIAANGVLAMNGSTVIDASRNLTNINLVKFREHTASFYISPSNTNTLNAQYGVSADTADMWINYRGYQDGFNQFRDFRIGDGKGNQLFFVDGSDRTFTFGGSAISTPKVAIGNVTPSKNLHIYTADNEGIFLQGTGGGVWMDVQSSASELWSMGCDTSGWAIYNRTDSAYYLRVGNTGGVNIYSGYLQVTNPSTSFDAIDIGSTTQAGYVNIIYRTNSGNAQIWKQGSNTDSWGSSSALNIYNSNGRIAFHPQGTANVLQIDSGGPNIGGSATLRHGGNTIIDSSRNLRNVTALASEAEYGQSMVGNFGQWLAHSYYATSGFNAAVQYWGWNFVQGTVNAPHTSSGQWYRNRVSLGNAYGHGIGSSDYWLEMAYPRTTSIAGAMYIRACENGSIGSWYEVGSNIRGSQDVAGNIVAGGNITAYSDERLKSDIQTLDGSKVLQMRGVSFTKNEEKGSGVIAQELEKIAPELVHDNEDGYKSVAYGNLTGYLIEAIKEQQEKIEKLEELVEKLISEK